MNVIAVRMNASFYAAVWFLAVAALSIEPLLGTDHDADSEVVQAEVAVATKPQGAGSLLADESAPARDVPERAVNGATGLSLDWYTVDGGGGTGSGGGFTLSGTIGQPDAGDMSGGDFTLRGGFWQVAAAAAPPCPTDLNNDGVVNAADLALLLGAWGPNPGSSADINGDDVVNAADLALLLGAWGPCP